MHVLATAPVAYVGLSGVLHGGFAFLGVLHTGVRMQQGFLVLGGLGLKIAWEQFFGSLPGVLRTDAVVWVDAHLYGAMGGVVVGWARLTVVSSCVSMTIMRLRLILK